MCKRIVGTIVLLLGMSVAVGCATPTGTVSRTLPADLVEVEVIRTEIDPEAQGQKVILQEKAGRRSLTIFIGLPEAYAIQRALTGETLERPMTHDLTTNLVTALGGQLERVVIELRENVFIATLVIKQGLATYQVDARASDALALALRTKAPIFVPSALIGAASSPRPVELGGT